MTDHHITIGAKAFSQDTKLPFPGTRAHREIKDLKQEGGETTSRHLMGGETTSRHLMLCSHVFEHWCTSLYKVPHGYPCGHTPGGMCLFYSLKWMGTTCTRRYKRMSWSQLLIPATGEQVPQVCQQKADVGNIMPCVDRLQQSGA